MHYKGQGVLKDYKEAAVWMRKAADQGLAVAQTNLGLMYIKGEGVAVNREQAARWFERAAEQWDGIAQTNLGLMYVRGQGVSQDPREAFRFFKFGRRTKVWLRLNTGLVSCTNTAGASTKIPWPPTYGTISPQTRATNRRTNAAVFSKRECLLPMWNWPGNVLPIGRIPVGARAHRARHDSVVSNAPLHLAASQTGGQGPITTKTSKVRGLLIHYTRFTGFALGVLHSACCRVFLRYFCSCVSPFLIEKMP